MVSTEPALRLLQDARQIPELLLLMGQHLATRDLRLSWRILTNIAFVTGVCAQLEPLSTYNLLLNRIRREHEELNRISDLTEAQGGLTYDQHRNPAVEGRLLSPQFEGVFSPSEIEWRPLAEQKRGWLTAQNFWSLVQMNPTLRSLSLDQSLDSLVRLESTDFFYSTLAALPQLTELDNTLVKTDLGEVLERLPNLRCNRSTNLEFPNQVLNKSYDHLHSLEIYASVPLITFFSILAQLTNLEELRIKEFVPRDRLMVNPGTYLNHTPTRLKGLHVMSDAARFGGIFAELILPWVPLLTDFTVDRLLDETVEALLVHCRKLETIRQADDGCTLYESRNTILQPTFDQTAPPGFEPLPTRKLYKLLRELPFL
ncbi:hypothetical protein BGX33_007441 [Mortierella sp. NVP41]|nr:hypothetical protein BGX33_007441 [Mortierella sp. NVP41]